MAHDKIRHNDYNIRQTRRMTDGLMDEDGLLAMSVPEAPPTIVVYDIMNENSVYNMLHFQLRSYVMNVPEEYRMLSPEALRAKVEPGPTLNRLRLNLWMQVDKVICSDEKMKKISTPQIIDGVCQPAYWNEVLKDPLLLAWVLTPVQSYQRQIEDVMETSLSKLREVLTHGSVLKANGKIDVGAAQLYVKIFEMFDKRVHGNYTQKVQTKIEHVNVDGGLNRSAEDIQKDLIKFAHNMNKKDGEL